MLDFRDADKVSGYAEQAMRWAVENGVMDGSDGVLDPGGRIARLEAAKLFQDLMML